MKRYYVPVNQVWQNSLYWVSDCDNDYYMPKIGNYDNRLHPQNWDQLIKGKIVREVSEEELALLI